VTSPQVDIANLASDVHHADPALPVMTLEEALVKYSKHIRSVAASMVSQYRLSNADREDLISAMRYCVSQLLPDMWAHVNYTKTCCNHAATKVMRRMVAYTSRVTPIYHVTAFRESYNSLLSDQPGDDLETEMLDSAPDSDSETTLIRKMALESALASLTDRQKQIISIMYGLNGASQTSDLRQIATRVGMGARQEKQVQREIDSAMARMRRAAGANPKPTDTVG
jgi:DNA-directed RNA polymerase specialized sigma24 family protein